ncbi:hypothetical protein MMC24_004868 [Lignoscripta atroalba]|nr:hypothetical protein [Lignoscripta atroalba]
MRRLQSNLAYLASIADRSHKPATAIPPYPAIMDGPPATPGSAISEESMQALKIAYRELRALYPDLQLQLQQQQQQQGGQVQGQGQGQGQGQAQAQVGGAGSG